MAEKAKTTAKKPVQKNLENETVENEVSVPKEDWITFLKKGGSKANSIISPSKFPEGDYEFVDYGETKVDYKDDNGLVDVQFLVLKSLTDKSTSKLKVTPTLHDTIEDLDFDIRTSKFHYSARLKDSFKVKISITKLDESDE